MKRTIAAIVTAATAACAGAPDPQPFRGPTPTSIAVLPIRAVEFPVELRELLDEGAGRLLADLGFEVVPPAVVGAAMPGGAAPGPQLLRGVQSRFGVEAVLERVARVLPGGVAGGGRAFAIRWTIVAPGSGEVLWTREEIGGPGVVVSRHMTGPLSRYESDPFFSDEPIIGRETGDWITEVRARDVVEQAAVVQRTLAARLPRAPERDDAGTSR